MARKAMLRHYRPMLSSQGNRRLMTPIGNGNEMGWLSLGTLVKQKNREDTLTPFYLPMRLGTIHCVTAYQ